MPIAPGEKFGRYDVEAQIGQGGMGEVYRATDTLLHRKVALKVLKAGRGGPEAVARLFREARAAAALSHPHTIAIHDLGETEGTVYIVMEYVSGKPLRAYVGDREVPLQTKVRWLIAIARALGAAHCSGVVHRDVKPSNVMITDDGDVKVLDFGLARKRDAGDFKTQAGFVLGTPKYMAPEQMGGVDGDPLSDEYSFGVTAYEVLTGKHPGMPSGAPLVPLDRADPEIAAEISAVIMRTLESDPAARFPTLDEAASALEAAAFGSMQVATIPERGDPKDTLRDIKPPSAAIAMSDVVTAAAPRTDAAPAGPSPTTATEQAPVAGNARASAAPEAAKSPSSAAPARPAGVARTLMSAEAPPGMTALRAPARAVRDETVRMPVARGSGAPPPVPAGSPPPPAGAPLATQFASNRLPTIAQGPQATGAKRSTLPLEVGLVALTALIGAFAAFGGELMALVRAAAPSASATTSAPASAPTAASASASEPAGDAAAPALSFVVPSLRPSGLPLTRPGAIPVPPPPPRPTPRPGTSAAPEPRASGALAF